MSLTTHSPQEPCVGHCIACGAFADWSEIITDLLTGLKPLAVLADDMDDMPSTLRLALTLEDARQARIVLNKVRSLLPEDRR